MARSIYRLLVAQAAGDPLSPDEEQRIADHNRRLLVDSMKAPQLFTWEERQQIPYGDDLAAMVARLRELAGATDDPMELRELLHTALGMLEHWHSFCAQQEGKFWRELRRQQRGSHNAADAKRVERETLRMKLDAIRAANPSLTLKAAAAKHLGDDDPAWEAQPRDEREKRVNRLLRRLRERISKKRRTILS